ncbi:deoxyribose-phosphate aldolase [Anaeromyxobacter diazotrophicus]|uniref:Deoxyribose-phosphate aldolase n=1 Tax=Anaeromyxobacter diazotrophicus TaxID=2590199 RepID=A0A7I9VI34_9BACT|nr:deoxyribose-phosphate aldolase [Anaeromyxobacter diazotrophicus]GEJ56072.1 deoxyribose-phosphate aldolase [Anaeromyxobacter diazotrophicus]
MSTPLASPRELAPLVDHTVLRPGAGEGEVERACDEALQHGFAGVCVREAHLALVVRRLAGAAPRPIAVADFPLGAAPAAARAEEARRLAALGAREIDVVFPLPRLAARDHAGALADLSAVVRAAAPAAVKVILETGALSGPEKAAACALALAAGAAFVKTSTGFGPGGATVEDVALLRALAGPAAGVKASGGIRTAADALRMVRAGANRLGTSAGVALVTGSW